MWNPFRRKRPKPPPPEAHFVLDYSGPVNLLDRLNSIEEKARAGEVLAALAELQSLEAEEGDYGNVALTRSFIMSISKRYPETEAAAAEAIKLLADRAESRESLAMAYNNRGYARLMQHRFNEALTDTRGAIAIDGWLIIARENLLNCLRETGEFAQMCQEAEALAKMAADKRIGYLQLAAARWQMSDHEGAIAAIRQGLKNHPGDANLTESLAFKLAAIGRGDEARQAVETLERLPGTFIEARVARGWIAYFEGDYQGALQIADEDRACGDWFAQLVHFCCLAVGDLEGMRSNAVKALDGDPENVDYACQLMAAECHLGNDGAAKAVLQRLLDAYPQAPGLLVWKLHFHVLSGELEAASALAEKLVAEYPKRAGVFCDAVEFLLCDGKHRRVLELIETLEIPHLEHHASLYRAIALVRLGEHEAARTFLDAADDCLARRPVKLARHEEPRVRAQHAAVRAELTGSQDLADEAMALLGSSFAILPSGRRFLTTDPTLVSLKNHTRWREVAEGPL